MEQEQGSQENLLPQAAPPLRKGHYLTRGGYHARLDTDIVERGLGVVREVGYVTYAITGEFAYKSEPYENHPGDSLDLLIETWQVQPFVQDQEQQKKRAASEGESYETTGNHS